MDYEALRNGLNGLIPFNKHVGLEYVEVGEGRGVVRLPDGEHLHNHVGSQHAGGLFAAGEAASGGAFAAAFAEHMAGLTPLAKSADIAYLKLARHYRRLLSRAQAGSAPLDRVMRPLSVPSAQDSGRPVALSMTSRTFLAPSS